MKAVTLKRIMSACTSEDYRGFCLACGQTAHGVEPDAREYICESCGEPKVYGAEECLIMGVGQTMRELSIPEKH